MRDAGFSGYFEVSPAVVEGEIIGRTGQTFEPPSNKRYDGTRDLSAPASCIRKSKGGGPLRICNIVRIEPAGLEDTLALERLNAIQEDRAQFLDGNGEHSASRAPRSASAVVAIKNVFS